MSKYTFKQFQAEYPDDDACLAAIMEVQYGGTKISCPGCGADSTFTKIAERRAYACQWCGHHIYPCAGTIFHKSSTKLTHWFFAMYLMTSTRHGVAAKELERQIGCTYKTAWRMAHELRKLMASADYQGPLKGHVEIDETWIGGRKRRTPGEKNRKRGAVPGKQAIVMGIVERGDGGKLRAGPIDDVTMHELHRHVVHNVEPGSTVSTDERRGYNDLAKASYVHGRVDHSAEQYVNGVHHTNTLEGHWSQLKRSIRGTHVHVSHKHLWKYVAEFSYRRNYRESHRGMFSRLVSAFSLPRLAET
jgi:transposase